MTQSSAPSGAARRRIAVTTAAAVTLLEQQFSGANESFNKVLQVSEGFSYTWDASAPAGSKVDPSTIQLDGETIDPNAVYRIVANNFLSDGGDGGRARA